jgi:hypothetical protein
MHLFISPIFNHTDRMKDTLLPAPSVCTSGEFLWNIVRPFYVISRRHVPATPRDPHMLCTHVSQFILCIHNTDNVLYELYASTLNRVCNFSYVLAVAPWWWFPCKPKHVGVASLILKCFNNSTFFNVCISWTIKWRRLKSSGRSNSFFWRKHLRCNTRYQVSETFCRLRMKKFGHPCATYSRSAHSCISLS